jgi:hypothetical protein
MSAARIGNQMLLLGGIHGYTNTAYYYTDHISRYDLNSDSWLDFPCQKDYVPGYRQFSAPAVVHGKVYLFGGFFEETPQNSLWAYSLKKIRQDIPIRDTSFTSGILEMDMADYFSTSGEEGLSYSLCGDYDDALVTASLENSVLRLERISQETGSTDIMVNVFDSEDTITSNPFTLELPVGIQTASIHKLSVYPNPAKGKVTFRYHLADAGNVSLELYHPSGQVMERIHMKNMAVGDHQLVWNLEGYSNGMYFVRLKSRKSTLVSKLMLNH